MSFQMGRFQIRFATIGIRANKCAFSIIHWLKHFNFWGLMESIIFKQSWTRGNWSEFSRFQSRHHHSWQCCFRKDVVRVSMGHFGGSYEKICFTLIGVNRTQSLLSYLSQHQWPVLHRYQDEWQCWLVDVLINKGVHLEQEMPNLHDRCSW